MKQGYRFSHYDGEGSYTHKTFRYVVIHDVINEFASFLAGCGWEPEHVKEAMQEWTEDNKDLESD